MVIRRWHVPFRFAVLAYLFFSYFISHSLIKLYSLIIKLYISKAICAALTRKVVRPRWVGYLLFFCDLFPLAFVLKRECRKVFAKKIYHSEYLGIDRRIILK